MSVMVRTLLGVIGLMSLIVGISAPITDAQTETATPTQTQPNTTCGWEGARFCVYGVSPDALQLTNVSTRCVERCGYRDAPPQRTTMPFNDLRPAASQDGTGQCIPFSPHPDDISANNGQLIDSLETSGCVQDGERLVVVEGTLSILEANGSVKSLSPECLFDLDVYAPTYEISVGSLCSSAFNITYTETLAIIADPIDTTGNPERPEPGVQLMTAPELLPSEFVVSDAHTLSSVLASIIGNQLCVLLLAFVLTNLIWGLLVLRLWRAKRKGEVK